MRILFLSILTTILFYSSFAQQKPQYDSSVIHTRAFSAKNLSEYKNRREFQYESVHEPPQSLWDRFRNWINSLIVRLFSKLGSGSLVTWVFAIGAIAVIVFFIIKISGMGDGGFFKKRSSKGLEYTVGTEDIHSMNFEEAIQQAVDDKNFRLAVRLLYLQSLKYLADNRKINWQLNKTNHHYLRELYGTSHHPEFARLTRQFERNWYGNIPVADLEFGTLRQSFANFNNQLN